MGRGRSSTNYTDAEKQLLLRAVAAVKPRRAACWHLVAAHYNARRDAGERDADSLKRKFKTMAAARATEPDDPYNARARELMERIKARAANGEDAEDDGDDDGEYDDEETQSQSQPHQHHQPAATYEPNEPPTRGHRAQSPSRAAQYPSRIPSLAPLLPGPPLPAPVAVATATGIATTRGAGDAWPVSSELAQLLLVIREENAQREAARRIEREEAIAREQRWRDEARELRRQERDEAAAREDRFRREMAEQRRRDREEAAARHEQMMVILATLLKPSADASAATNGSANRV